jgi:hypothetical protein
MQQPCTASLPSAFAALRVHQHAYLPVEVWASMVLEYLDAKTAVRVGKCCMTLRRAYKTAIAIPNGVLATLHNELMLQRSRFERLRLPDLERVLPPAFVTFYENEVMQGKPKQETLVRAVDVPKVLEWELPSRGMDFDEFVVSQNVLNQENQARMAVLEELFVRGGEGAASNATTTVNITLTPAGRRTASELFNFFDSNAKGGLTFGDLSQLNNAAGIQLNMNTYTWVTQNFPVDTEGRLTLRGYQQLFISNYRCLPQEMYADICVLRAHVRKCKFADVLEQVQKQVGGEVA